MADWIDHLTASEAQAVLDAPVKTRFMAKNDRGERAWRYAKPTIAELARIQAKVRA